MESRPDWNATAYHRVATPQTAWGREVVERLQLRGEETVLDAGCGTGKLSRLLAERLPRGHVIAVDSSTDMLRVAQQELSDLGSRVQLVQATLPQLPALGPVDAILSTATLHWVLDHPATYRAFRAVTRPGGQLEFQCGGAGNLERLHQRAAALAASPAHAAAFKNWSDPWCLASAEQTESELRAAGWTDVRCWLEARPTPFADAAAFADFIANVNLRPFLGHLSAGQAQAFIATLVEEAASDDPPFVLDYVRLNASARASSERLG